MQISGNHVWQGSAVQFLKRKMQVYQSSLRPMATSKPDQNIKKKRFVYFWKEANKVERSVAHSRRSKGQSPSLQESITRILWYWVKLDLNCVLVLCFLIVWFFHKQQEDMIVLLVLLPKGYQYRASYDLPQTCLPEKAFSHAKRFCFLPVIKMEICKQRLDTTQQWYMWAGFFFLWI